MKIRKPQNSRGAYEGPYIIGPMLGYRALGWFLGFRKTGISGLGLAALGFRGSGWGCRASRGRPTKITRTLLVPSNRGV